MPEERDRQSDPPPRKDPPTSKIIDVRGMIRQASTRVRVDQLVQQGKKYISLLSKEKIEELVNQSVKNIVDKYRAVAAGVSDVPAAQIEAESRQEFGELLQQFQETSKAKNQLEVSRASLDKELEDLRKDLERQKALADGRLSEEIEKTLIVGFKEFERELDRITGKVFERRRLLLGEQPDPQMLDELKQIEEILRKIIQRILAAERERFSMAGGRDREIAFMEKRIEKLYEQIAAMEGALRTISTSKLYSNQQIQNLLRQLGLVSDDRNFEKKREMLKFVLGQNKDLRVQFKDMEGKGITLANPAGVGDGKST